MQSRHVASIGLLVGFVVAAAACGGKQPEAKTPDDKPAEAKTEEGSSSSEEAKKNESEEKTDAPEKKTSDEPACPHNTGEVVESRIGKVSVSTGCLSPKEAEKILSQYFKDLHACFTKELARDRKAKGGVTIRINVGQKGTYSVRVTKSEAPSEEFVGCLIGVLEPLPYPKPAEGGATIEFVTDLK